MHAVAASELENDPEGQGKQLALLTKSLAEPAGQRAQSVGLAAPVLKVVPGAHVTPEMHVALEVAPRKGEYVASAQAVQLVEGKPPDQVPAAQRLHAPEFDSDSVPGGQGEHAEEPAGEKEPALQGEQAVPSEEL